MSTPSLILRAEPAGQRSASGVHDALLALALYLLPFSLGEEIVVVSYSLPVFVLLLLYYAARFVHAPTRIDRGVADILIVSGIVVVIMVTTSFFAQDVFRSLSRVAFHLNGWFILFFFCTSIVTGDRDADIRKYKGLVKIFVRSGVVMAAYYIVNFIFQSLEHGVEPVLAERWTGGLASLPWGASNTVAAALLMPFSICLLVLAEEPPAGGEPGGLGLSRAEWVIYALVMALGVLFTLSRTVAAVLSMLLIFFFMRRAKTAALISALSIALVAFALADLGLAEEIIDQRLFSGDIDTFNNRSEIWSDFWGFIASNPFGLIGYYNALFDIGYTGHNFSLTTYVEQSLLGWLAAAALFVLLLRKSAAIASGKQANDRAHGRFLIAALCAIALNLHFEDAYYTHQYITYWWLFVSLVCLRYIIAQEAAVPIGVPREIARRLKPA